MDEEEQSEEIKLEDIKIKVDGGKKYEYITEKEWVIAYFKTPKGKVHLIKSIQKIKAQFANKEKDVT